MARNDDSRAPSMKKPVCTVAGQQARLSEWSRTHPGNAEELELDAREHERQAAVLLVLDLLEPGTQAVFFGFLGQRHESCGVNWTTGSEAAENYTVPGFGPNFCSCDHKLHRCIDRGTPDSTSQRLYRREKTASCETLGTACAKRSDGCRSAVGIQRGTFRVV